MTGALSARQEHPLGVPQRPASYPPLSLPPLHFLPFILLQPPFNLQITHFLCRLLFTKLPSLPTSRPYPRFRLIGPLAAHIAAALLPRPRLGDLLLENSTTEPIFWTSTSYSILSETPFILFPVKYKSYIYVQNE